MDFGFGISDFGFESYVASHDGPFSGEAQPSLIGFTVAPRNAAAYIPLGLHSGIETMVQERTGTHGCVGAVGGVGK